MQTLTATPSRHKCLVYDGHVSAQLSVVVPFLRDGLADNWRCLYLGSPEAVAMADGALAAAGVDTRQQIARGALIMTSDRGHLVDGVFDPDVMIDALCGLVDEAVHAGFEGLCATGDMRWELGRDENFQRLVEYEARLEEVIRRKPLRGICQYHREMVPAQAVKDALMTHQSAYIGDVLNRDNLFYLPPEVSLSAVDSASGEWMCQQIVRVLEAEAIRDDALAELRESEAHQRALAEALAETNAHLERRVAERTAALTAANQSLESFSYSVSHDLRAPLRAISGFSDMLAREAYDGLSEKSRQYLERVRTSAKRMDELIDGMMALAQVSKIEFARRPVDLTTLAEQVVRELRESAPDRAVTVTVQPGLHAMGDSILVRAVLQNLLGNAWKFTGKQEFPSIEVGQTDATRGYRTFFVRDNGAGFDPKYASRLFGVFQRLHTEQEFTGTGVGLATVQRILRF